MEQVVMELQTLQVGDIAVNEWGMGMSLVDFFIVEKRTAKTVTFRHIGDKTVDPDHYGQKGYKLPDTDQRGGTFSKKVKISEWSNEKYEWCNSHRGTYTGSGIIKKWNGKPTRWDTYD
tara:strand:+ start:236 stop:589 length:354 start_codon:yes stop_codon:yes gene_type:complete